MATHIACFDMPIQGQEVTVYYTFTTVNPPDVEVTKVMYNGANILKVLHPDDYDDVVYLCERNAPEALAEERACAAESRWEAKRDDALHA